MTPPDVVTIHTRIDSCMNQQVRASSEKTDVPTSTKRRDLATIAALGLLLYGLNADFWLYGDSAMYADFSMRRSFGQVSLHIGYYYIVVAAQATFGALFQLPIEQTMAWLNVASGAAVLCLSYLLALELIPSRTVALLATAMLGVSGRMISNATTSEIYMTQTMFVLWSFLCFVRGKTLWAAATAAASMLVSPLSIFAFLFYPVVDYQRTGKVRIAELLKLGVVSFALYVPYLIVHGYDLLWGVRGLLVIRDITPTEPSAIALNFPKYQFKAFTAMLLLCAPALLALRKYKHLFVLSAAVALPHLYVIIKLTGEDNVFIFNTDFFFALLLALGWIELLRRRRTAWIGPALFVTHVALFVVSRAIFAFNTHASYAAEIRNVHNEHLRGRNAKLITDWGTTMAYVFHARDSATTDLAEEPVIRQVYDIDNEPDSNVVALDGPELYLLDRWNPTPLNKLFRSQAQIDALMQINSVRFISERRYGLRCELIEERTNRLYRCTKNARSAS